MKEVTVHVHNGIDYPLNANGRCGWHLCSHKVYNSFDDPEEIKVMRVITLNEDDMSCDHSANERLTCGHCFRNWCGICKPTPSARCPYEYDHKDDDNGRYSLSREFDDEVDTAPVELMLDGEWVEFRPVADIIAGSDLESVAAITNRVIAESPAYQEFESKFLPGDHTPEEIWDIHNEGFLDDDEGVNAPCPVCGESGGFHTDDAHRNVDPKYLLEKGWHQSK